MEYLWLVPVSFLACFILLLGAVFRVPLLVNLGALLIICIVVFFAVVAANARDPVGRWANSELKPWFDSLKSDRGPCCSDADGTAISDVDWENNGGHYRVRIDGEWVDVPDDAVITEPNRAGRAIVWPIRYWDSGKTTIVIRCFLPGPLA